MKNGSIECHILGRKLVAPKKIQDFPVIQKSKHVIRAFITQTFPAVGIDVIHHETDIFLGIGIQICAFWQKTAYKFMIPFRRAFLVRSTGVTVEYMCPQIALTVVFNSPGIGKFRSVVSEADFKKLTETVRTQLV